MYVNESNIHIKLMLGINSKNYFLYAAFILRKVIPNAPRFIFTGKKGAKLYFTRGTIDNNLIVYILSFNELFSEYWPILYIIAKNYFECARSPEHSFLYILMLASRIR